MAPSSQKTRLHDAWPPWDFMPPPDDREWRTRNPKFEKYPLINECFGLRGEVRQVRLYSPIQAKYRVVSLSSGQFFDLSVHEIVAQCEDPKTAALLATKAQQHHHLPLSQRHSGSITTTPAESPEVVPSQTTKAMVPTGATLHVQHASSSPSEEVHHTTQVEPTVIVTTTTTTCGESDTEQTSTSAKKVTPNAQESMQRKRLMKQLEITMVAHTQGDTKKRRSLEKPIRVTGSRVVKGRKSVAFRL